MDVLEARVKCAICSRPMSKPAVVIGHMKVGRVCAEKAGLIVRKKRVAPLFDRPGVVRDNFTRDWVQEVAA